LKIIYISNSIGNKAQGGSSLSGLHFLEMLKQKFPEQKITVLSDSLHNSILQAFSDIIFIKSINKMPSTFNLLAWLKFWIKYLINLFCHETKILDCKGHNVFLFVNSFSNLLEKVSLKNYSNLVKVCVVRGDVDSFKFQPLDNQVDPLSWPINYLNNFDELIYVSKGIQENWNVHVNKSNHYLPNSINEHEFIQKKSKNPYKKKKFNILIVGSLQYRKGQELVPKIAKILCRHDVEFHCVGGISSNDGGDEIRKILLENNINYHGHSNKIFDYIYHADICLMLSKSEAFPRTVAEYLFIGKPVITTDVSGATEMVQHKLNGYIVSNKCNNIAGEFAKKINSLLNDKKLRKQFSVESKKKYEKQFSSQNQYQTFDAIIERLKK